MGVFYERRYQKLKKPVTREEKETQIRKEAKATLILFFICVIWHVGFGFGLSAISDLRIAGLPLWWIVSTPGVLVVAVIGVVILLTKVFVNFNLNDEEESISREVSCDEQ